MRTIQNYTAPATADFAALKNDLGLTGAQMADLFALGGAHQWRKYTGGQAPRAMSAHMLFYGCAQLELSEEQLRRVMARMRAVGASFDYTDPGAR